MSDAAIFSDEPHIVDTLIFERAPRLLSNPYTRGLFKKWLVGPLRYHEARAMADDVRHRSGREIMELLARDLALDVRDIGLTHVPTKGAAILVANHPTGLADGIAVFESVRRRRLDMRFLVNSDAIRAAPRLIDVMIPIELARQRRGIAASRNAFRHLDDAVRKGQLLIVFPSGRLAYLSWRGLREREWLPSVLSIARRHRLPVVPLHIDGHNSMTFYLLSLLSAELRDVTLFRELINKRRRSFKLSYGAPLDAHDLPDDPRRAVGVLQHHVERLLPMRARAQNWDHWTKPLRGIPHRP